VTDLDPVKAVEWGDYTGHVDERALLDARGRAQHAPDDGGFGGRRGDRTPDLCIANAALSQLS
jgi:hypothetical protein